LRLVHLTEAEYAVVEGGGSLKRGHLVDHRFNLIVSAKQRDPIYKVEGDAGYILHFMATSPDRADVIARPVYAPAFLPPPAKPGPEANHPLVTDTVRRPAASPPASDDGPPSAEERAKRADVERKALEERRRKEEAERKAAEERRRKEEAERKVAAERAASAEERAKRP